MESKMSLSNVLLKQNQATQSLGQNNRENCTCFLVLSYWNVIYMYIYILECYIYIIDNQKAIPPALT